MVTYDPGEMGAPAAKLAPLTTPPAAIVAWDIPSPLKVNVWPPVVATTEMLPDWFTVRSVEAMPYALVVADEFWNVTLLRGRAVQVTEEPEIGMPAPSVSLTAMLCGRMKFSGSYGCWPTMASKPPLPMNCRL